MDTFWIKMRMKALGIKQKDLAAEIGMTQASLSHKLKNFRPMTLQEAAVLVRRLQMTADEVMEHLLDEGEKQ